MNTEPHKEENIFALCDVIRETSFAIYKYLRSGHREQIYENALAHRLGKLGIQLHSSRNFVFTMKTGHCSAISELIS